MYSELQYADLVFSITETVDLISPVLANHHKLVAYISYSLGKKLGLTIFEQLELEIAGSLHDIGGLTLKERLAPVEFEYEDRNFHSEKGYLLLNKFIPLSNIAKLIRYHHCKWLNGNCKGVNGEEIPFGSHILNIADRIAISIDKEVDNILTQVDEIVLNIKRHKGEIFHPKIVEAFEELSVKDSFWLGMKYLENPNFINKDYKVNFFSINEEELEGFMKVLSQIVDFKSRFTAAHSSTVAACAESIARLMGFNKDDMKMIIYAGYIHDLGKLAVPTEILEKTSELTKEEFSQMRVHAYHTNRVLSKVNGFEIITSWGALHHEKLNGTGYPFGLRDSEIPLGARILAVADIFTAIREKRPYRAPMSKEETISVLVNMSDAYQIDKSVVEILLRNFDELDIVREKANKEAVCQYDNFNNEFMKNKL